MIWLIIAILALWTVIGAWLLDTITNRMRGSLEDVAEDKLLWVIILFGPGVWIAYGIHKIDDKLDKLAKWLENR